MSQSSSPEIERLLETLATGESSHKVSAAQKLAQVGAGNQQIIDALVAATNDQNPYVRTAARQALVALGQTPPPSNEPPPPATKPSRLGNFFLGAAILIGINIVLFIVLGSLTAILPSSIFNPTTLAVVLGVIPLVVNLALIVGVAIWERRRTHGFAATGGMMTMAFGMLCVLGCGFAFVVAGAMFVQALCSSVTRGGF